MTTDELEPGADRLEPTQTVTSLASLRDLLRVWFGEPGSSPLASSKKWFTKDEAFDRALRDRFEGTLEAVVRGEVDPQRASPREKLALVILLDQISRNIYRGTARSFAQDEIARAITVEMLESGADRTLGYAERYFVLMPLMHAEDAALQRRCVAEFEALLAGASDEARELLTSAVEYAKRHAVIVERFGRFPHRNAILGRSSTPEEVEFLKQPGSSF